MATPQLDAKDLLLADLEHFGQSMLANEQVGEKRFEFFVTLSTAVIAGLVALASGDTAEARALSVPAALAGLGGLLVFGVLTYLRLLHRDSVTDEYQRTLKYIRNTYREQCSNLQAMSYSVPRNGAHRRRLTTAGYAQTVGIINGGLLAGVLWVPVTDLRWQAVSGVAGVAAAAWLWFVARRDKRRKVPAAYFRAGVGAVIVGPDSRVLVLERSDRPGAWQFPQGGLEDGESPETAVLREIHEETGIRRKDVRLLAEYPEPLAYVLPHDRRTTKTGLGQVQWWFFFEYTGKDVVLPAKGEFRQFDWRRMEVVVADAVTFRKPVYEQLRTFLAGRGTSA